MTTSSARLAGKVGLISVAPAIATCCTLTHFPLAPTFASQTQIMICEDIWVIEG